MVGHGPAPCQGMISAGPDRVTKVIVHLINDRYELLEVIASGGMATVWRSRDVRLNRVVALKRPHPATPGDPSTARLTREARAAAALNHPNLITVYDFGTDDEGPYLVMELVEGRTLQDLAGELDLVEIRDLGVALANALAAIHTAGIVHRDVKPANVIMSDRGPLLTDFGIAVDPNAIAEITAPGQVVATPSYAAPEVLRGEPPTPASDIYSLGVMIEELSRRTGEEDETISQALGAAMSPSPEDRPRAAEFAALLGSAAPTTIAMAGSDTTMILETTPTPPTVGPATVPDSGRRGWVWAATLLALLAIGLLVIGVALSGDDPPAAATDTTPPAEAVTSTSTTSTTAATTTTTASTTTTSTTTTTTTTLPGAATAIVEARDELESILSRPPRSDLNPSEVEDLMKEVDEAIAAVERGDREEAGNKLMEVARTIDEKLDGEDEGEAIGALEKLAELLGFEVQRRDGGDDDGDDD